MKHRITEKLSYMALPALGIFLGWAIPHSTSVSALVATIILLVCGALLYSTVTGKFSDAIMATFLAFALSLSIALLTIKTVMPLTLYTPPTYDNTNSDANVSVEHDNEIIVPKGTVTINAPTPTVRVAPVTPGSVTIHQPTPTNNDVSAETLSTYDERIKALEETVQQPTEITESPQPTITVTPEPTREPTQNVTTEDIDALKETIKALEEKVATLESQTQSTPTPTPTSTPTTTPTPYP